MQIENLLFILLIAMAVLFKLLASKIGEAKKRQEDLIEGRQRARPPPSQWDVRRSNRMQNAFADFSKRSASRQGRDRHRQLCRAQIFRRDLSLRCNLPLGHFPCRAVDSLPKNAGKGT